MLYYVIIIFKKISFFKSSGARTSDVTGTGTRKPDAGIGRRRWPETLQGTHRGSEGQGKLCRESLSNAAW
ncbi:unnamed protein product [Staurois parvus]|uniref:Uncharacterized protein n=1 Tax=Staurois parvus TaxID=386267 RepID=A0ABN9BU68_9NEOB|nr:unnamed protein product [Staurois parvus]